MQSRVKQAGVTMRVARLFYGEDAEILNTDAVRGSEALRSVEAAEMCRQLGRRFEGRKGFIVWHMDVKEHRETQMWTNRCIGKKIMSAQTRDADYRAVVSSLTRMCKYCVQSEMEMTAVT